MPNWKNRIIGLEHVNPKEITKHPLNYKDHPDLQQRMMTGIFDDIGWVDIVIVNKNTGNLLDGHMRVDLAVSNNEATIPVLYVDVDEDEEAKILSTHDPIGAFAKEKGSLVREVLDNISTDNQNVLDLVERFAKRNRVEFGRYDPDDKQTRKDERKKQEEEMFEQIKDEWGVKEGNVYRIESKTTPGFYHRVICGDSADQSTVKKLMGKEEKKAILMATDPPYGIDFSNQKYNPYAKDWDGISGDDKSGVALRDWFKTVLNTWIKYMDDRASFYIWSAMFEEGFALYYALKDAGLNVQSQIAWIKSHITLGQADYQWKHEICWYAFKRGKKHTWYGGRDQNTVWEIAKVGQGDYIHPFQKPIDLYATPIRNHTKPGDICVDPFLGSGTQIIAAEQFGRLCYGAENDPKWVATALKRAKDFGLEVNLE